MAPEDVDAYLAGLSDGQARQVLAHKLKQEAAGNLTPGASGDWKKRDERLVIIFHKLTLGASLVLDQIASFFSMRRGRFYQMGKPLLTAYRAVRASVIFW